MYRCALTYVNDPTVGLLKAAKKQANLLLVGGDDEKKLHAGDVSFMSMQASEDILGSVEQPVELFVGYGSQYWKGMYVHT